MLRLTVVFIGVVLKDKCFVAFALLPCLQHVCFFNFRYNQLLFALVFESISFIAEEATRPHLHFLRFFWNGSLYPFFQLQLRIFGSIDARFHLILVKSVAFFLKSYQ